MDLVGKKHSDVPTHLGGTATAGATNAFIANGRQGPSSAISVNGVEFNK